MFDSTKERIDDLCRGGLRIIQNPSAPCFAVDAILLADFVQMKPSAQIIDLGTGSGVIPLLLWAKEHSCRVQGLELMPQMADMAARSVALNGLESAIQIIQGDICLAERYFAKGAADIVTANPPYYLPGCGKVSDDPLFAAARSEVACNLEQVLTAASALLKPLGSFYGVLRGIRLTDMLWGLRQQHLEPSLLRMVQPNAAADANLFLVEAKKGCRRELRILPPLVVYRQPGVYGEEMMAIYQGRSGCS